MSLQTMYAGMINSPETTITNSLGPADTTIYVLDPSRVPTPPNLMTLGTGTNAETVLVTGLSDNALTVVRGYQGIAKDWLPGTIIARNFTEYDHAAFKANITDLGTAVDDLAGAGRTTETVMGAYAVAASAATAAADAAADASDAAADAAAAQAAAVAARAKVKSYTLAAASWTASGSTWRQTGTFPGLTDDYVLNWSWATSTDGQACVDAELMLDASASGGSATLTWTAKNKPTAAIAVFVSAYLPVAV